MPSPKLLLLSTILALTTQTYAQGNIACNTTAAPDGSIPIPPVEPGQDNGGGSFPLGFTASKFCDAVEANGTAFQQTKIEAPLVLSVTRSGDKKIATNDCFKVFTSIVEKCLFDNLWGGEVAKDGVTFEIHRDCIRESDPEFKILKKFKHPNVLDPPGQFCS